MTSLLWFRNDLRLSDNPALLAAVNDSNNLIPVYILDNGYFYSEAQLWWLHHSLIALYHALKKRGVTLILKKGEPKKILTSLVKNYKIEKIYWNRIYEPYYIKHDNEIINYFSKKGIKTYSYNDNLLTEPAEIKNKSKKNFKIYTPYWNTLNELLSVKKLIPVPKNMLQHPQVKMDLSSWSLLPKNHDWSKDFNIWSPGEKNAQHQLTQFIEKKLQNYHIQKDRVDLSGTSQLSPYLHFGEISIWQIWNSIKQVEIKNNIYRKGVKAYLRQLIWREFAYYLLFHFPNLDKKNFNNKFDSFKWKKNKTMLRAWQQGLTGYPIVDAGMRELLSTGYIHNRIRMIVASFLTKDLMIDWREGANWFLNTLVDADIANNTIGWQWVAGCGPNAAPFFRVFNPVLQGNKFDPNGDYVRKWVPELSELPRKHIHDPSNAPKNILNSADVKIGKNYPFPIVNHKRAREKSLNLYKKLKN